MAPSAVGRLSANQRKCTTKYRPLTIGLIALVLLDGCSETEYKIAEGGAGAVAMGGAHLGGTAGDGGFGTFGGSTSKAGNPGWGGAGTGGTGNPPSIGGSKNSLGGTTAVNGTSSGGISLGGASLGGASNTGYLCGLAPNPSDDRSKRRILVRDEATSRLAFIDIENKDNSWDIILDREDGPEDGDPFLSQGRDLQLVGNCRVLIGTHLGYDEYDLLTHQRVAEVTSFPGTISAQRLRNKNTLLVGVGTEASPWQSLVGIVLVQVNSSGAVVGSPLVYPGTYAYLVRETAKGTYLIANNQRVIEGTLLRNDPDNGYNQVLPTVFTVSNDTQPHAWMGLRVTSALGIEETIVSTGDDAKIRIYSPDGTLRKTITGGVGQVTGGATAVEPYFFAGLQVLPNGNYLVTNSSGKVSGNFTKRIPILEYNPAGALVWYWGDPTYADRLSGIHAAIVLDGLDPTKLNVEGSDGKLVALE